MGSSTSTRGASARARPRQRRHTCSTAPLLGRGWEQQIQQGYGHACASRGCLAWGRPQGGSWAASGSCTWCNLLTPGCFRVTHRPHLVDTTRPRPSTRGSTRAGRAGTSSRMRSSSASGSSSMLLQMHQRRLAQVRYPQVQRAVLAAASGGGGEAWRMRVRSPVCFCFLVTSVPPEAPRAASRPRARTLARLGCAAAGAGQAGNCANTQQADQRLRRLWSPPCRCPAGAPTCWAFPAFPAPPAQRTASQLTPRPPLGNPHRRFARRASASPRATQRPRL